MSTPTNAGPSATASAVAAASLIHSPSAATSIIYFARMTALQAAIQLLILLNMLSIYKWVARACGWYHRDQGFHQGLGELSRQSMRAGGGAVSAVVCSAGSDGRPTIPGRQFFLLLEEEDKTIKIKRLPNGDLDLADCRQKWIDQLMKLGMDVTNLKM